MSFLIRRYSGDGNYAPRGPFGLNKNSPQAQGLVSWVPGDQMNLDRSAYSRPITPNGTVASVANAYGMAWNFDGATTDYLTIDRAGAGGALNFTGDFTMTWWMERHTNSINLVRQEDNLTTKWWNLYIANDGGLSGQFDDGTTKLTFASSILIPFRVPTLMSVVRTLNSDYVFWKNGTEFEALGSGNGDVDGGFDIQWGRAPTNTAAGDQNGQRYNGRLWDMRVYNHALSDVELYNMYKPSTRWDLYWQPKVMVMASEFVAAPAGGRVMSSLAGAGGLAGRGGVAGAGGGLAA